MYILCLKNITCEYYNNIQCCQIFNNATMMIGITQVHFQIISLHYFYNANSILFTLLSAILFNIFGASELSVCREIYIVH